MPEKQIPQEPKNEKKCSCPPGAPTWMVTYSDLVTLLLTFFVLLLSMANMDPEKLLKASSSIKDAFGIHYEPSQMEYTIPVLPSNPVLNFSPIQFQTTKKIYEKIKSQIDSLRLNDDIGLLNRDNEAIILRVKDTILFKPGQSKLSIKAGSTLRTVADIIKPLPMNLRIEGHTDNNPVLKKKFGNWELSIDRSVSVLRFFTRNDLLPLDRMSAIGYGMMRPIASNKKEATRALNRRVDFVLELNTFSSSERDKTSANPIVPL